MPGGVTVREYVIPSVAATAPDSLAVLFVRLVRLGEGEWCMMSSVTAIF